MSLSYPGVLEQQPSDKGNEIRFSNTLKQVPYLQTVFVWEPYTVKLLHIIKESTSYIVCDCFGIRYILPNQQVFCKKFIHYWQNVFTGQIQPAGCGLETSALNSVATLLWRKTPEFSLKKKQKIIKKTRHTKYSKKVKPKLEMYTTSTIKN